MSKNDQEHAEVEEQKEEVTDEVEETSGPLSFWDMLEERIVQLVRKIALLQEENAKLKSELVEKEKALKEAVEERDKLKKLKKEMREKVERLIVKIEEYQEMADKEELPKPSKE